MFRDWHREPRKKRGQGRARGGLGCPGPPSDSAQGSGASVRGSGGGGHVGLLPRMAGISLQLLAVLGLCQTRHNGLHLGDTAEVSQAGPRGVGWGGRRPSLRREVWREEAHCHSWYGSLSRSRTASGLTLGSL